MRNGEVNDNRTGEIIYEDEDYKDENINEIDWMESSLDNLISNHFINKEININEEKNGNQTLTEFKKNNINRLYEEMLCYFSSPEILKIYKSSVIDQDKNYLFYKDYISENFMIEQRERIKRISKLPKIKKDSIIKKRKLLNYENIFFSSPLDSETDDFKENHIEVNNLRIEMEKYSQLFFNENDNIKLLSYLKNLIKEFSKAKLDVYYLGLVHFNFIENNLVLLLTIIKNKLDKKKNKKNSNDFIMECSNILKYFKSSKLFYFILKCSKENIDILENLKIKDDLVQFITTYDMIFFKSALEAKENKNQVCVLRNVLTTEEEKRNYRTIVYDNYLMIFLDMNNNSYDYLKIHMKNGIILYKGKIDFAESDAKIIDISVSLKNDIIYLVIIIENNKKFGLKYALLNKFTSTLIKKGEIELNKENFEPFLLLNDNKFFYCISKNNNLMLILKKNSKLNNLKYIQYNLLSSDKILFS